MTKDSKLIIARYGEIHLKGDNRGFFLKALKDNLEQKLKMKVSVADSRVVVKSNDENIAKQIADTFGIVSVSMATKVASDYDKIMEHLATIKITGSFKVEVNRADKRFPYKSPEFARIAGAQIFNANKDVVVNLENPDNTISIDIRDNGTYIYEKTIAGVGGLPVGTAGRALVMLSGGIDSPVSAWLAAKRGLALEYIHFYSPPYTSAFALEKVKDLARKLENYCGDAKLHIVPFTQIQDAIRNSCNEEYMITLMRRFMVRITEQLAINRGLDCIITGENLSQVASQTVQSITSNDICAVHLPILRPLITFDKIDIVKIAKQIDTYQTSIQPHLDCCTVFIPKRPSIKPNLKKVEEEEAKLNVTELINKAMNSIWHEQIS